jgi:transposase
MPAAKEILVMDDGDLKECQQIWRSRNRPVSVARRARMLLLAAQGYSNRGVALKLGVNAHVVGRVRGDYGERGLAVLSDRHRSGRPRSSRNEQIVPKVVERVWQAPAKGLSRWSVRTLAQHLKMPFASVGRILREQKFYPHRLRTFTFSPDPQFGEKLLKVVAPLHEPTAERSGALHGRKNRHRPTTLRGA